MCVSAVFCLRACFSVSQQKRPHRVSASSAAPLTADHIGQSSNNQRAEAERDGDGAEILLGLLDFSLIQFLFLLHVSSCGSDLHVSPQCLCQLWVRTVQGPAASPGTQDDSLTSGASAASVCVCAVVFALSEFLQRSEMVK